MVIPSIDIIWAWLREGWRYRVKQGNRELNGPRRAEYVEQIKREMDLIVGQDFIDYFLLCSLIIRFAKDKGISVGPGRGSSAASVVCWLLRITEVDPMLYPLMDFSRFIVPGREDLPDIDTDFDDELRYLVREFAVETFGADRVGNISTFTKYKGKNSIDDVSRVYQIPKAAADALKSMIVERSGGDSRADAALLDTIEMFETAQEIVAANPGLMMATRLEGGYRSMSTHAAGLVIANSAVADVCAMYSREDKNAPGQLLTSVSVNKYDAEYLNLMKMDLLGLSTMGMITRALREADMTLEDLYRIPTDDAETIEAFRRNDVTGIFQFEGRATRLVCRDIKPDNFLELVDINGLSRPGPLFSGTTAEYTRVKHGLAKPVSIHPVIDEITKGTKGTIIYQEQILRALALFGGINARRVHEIRRIISLKLGEAQFNTSSQAFIDGARELHGVSEKVAMAVWGRVVTSASYAFVYAHSLSYTLIGYWCMWLKIHHPAAFYAAQLSKVEKDKWPRLIKDAQNHGITVAGVTFGSSGLDWSAAGKKRVAAGYLQLNGVGPALAARIIAYQEEHGAFAEPEEMLRVSGIGPKTLDGFRSQLGADDPFGLRAVERAITEVRRGITTGDLPFPNPNYRSEEILDVPGGDTVIWVGMVKLKEYKDYVEDERARSGKEIAQIKAEMDRPDLATSCVLHCFDDGDEDVYVRITRFNYPKFRKALESITLGRDVIWVRAKKSKGGFGASIYVHDLAVIEPD